MRGSLILHHFLDLALRIIPAHAGLTLYHLVDSLSTWDHPRACGAHHRMDVLMAGLPGSSPRMRGSPLRGSGNDRRNGIIPAHAGLTTSATARTPVCRDHPRACGAHLRRELEQKLYKGSSPRMRGSPHDSRNASRRHGIIPAHAGLTMHDYAFADSLRDHPRACGAHSHQRCVEQTSVGSSPRMRGSQVKDNGATDKPGIIPAHAGLTSSEYTAYRADRDHPRACGAHATSRLWKRSI